MPSTIDRAIARQAQAQSVPEPIPAEDALLRARAWSMAIASTRPRGLAVLAWCQEHPAEVGTHTDLVENLRVGLALGQPIGKRLLALWAEVPGTCHVEPAKAKG